MRKITYDWIDIELTRRCNIACEHCMRGDAQNIDIEESTIDSFLAQTQIIGKLLFGGGEPTLCLDKMKYILDGMKKRGVLLFGLEITTNGYMKSKEFIQIIRDYGEYIKYCWMNKKLKLPYYVKIQVSVDKYHAKAGNYDPEDSYWWYKVNLYNYAQVDRLQSGNYPKKKGRAKNLPEAYSIDYSYMRNDKRVEILSKDIKPCCPNYKNYKLIYEDQIYVVCDLCISVKGNMAFLDFTDNIWDVEDNNIICNVNGDIYEQIIEFNKGKLTCVEYMKREKANIQTMERKFLEDNLEAIISGDIDINNISDFYSNIYINKNEFDPNLHHYSKQEKKSYSDYGNLEETETQYQNYNYNIE